MEQIQITNYYSTVNGLFVLQFQRIAGENNTTKDSFSDYYVPNVEIKDFNLLIDGKRFFDLPVKMKKKLTRKLLK